MVKIAIAGGSGNVAFEVIDALVAVKKHDIVILSRKDTPMNETRPRVSWRKTNYQDQDELAETLQGVHTVLSFIVTQSDPGSMSQKNLISAAIRAGVTRFAPSEWATSHFKHLDWYVGKAEIRQYLAELNRDKKVLEYSLFLPGLFTNYFTFPYKSGKQFNPFQTHIDFNNCRAIALKGRDNDRITLTTVQDLAEIVARAVEFSGEWPVIGGIKGCELSVGELIALGEKIRKQPFRVDRFRVEDVETGALNASWLPIVDHPGIPRDQAEVLASALTSRMLLGISAGVLNVTDEWNRLLPDYQFTQAEDFLRAAWKDKV